MGHEDRHPRWCSFTVEDGAGGLVEGMLAGACQELSTLGWRAAEQVHRLSLQWAGSWARQWEPEVSLGFSPAVSVWETAGRHNRWEGETMGFIADGTQ